MYIIKHTFGLARVLQALIFTSAAAVVSMQAQEGRDRLLTIEYEQAERGSYIFYANNRNSAPYQVELRFYDRNSDAEIRPATYRIVPPNSERFKLTTHLHKSGDPPFRFRYRHFFGDPAGTKHRNDHVYLLPYRHGEGYVVLQGYHGRFSHQNEYSIDFEMPEGTPVYAARSGLIIHVKDDSNRGGPDPAYRQDGNYISVLHDDGTFAEYVHLRFRGSRVRVGERVRAGDHIAYSGNTGFSTTPHLHFSVKVPVYMRYDTTPTIFRFDNNKTGRLEQGRKYRAVHF
jgi:murein DD-endopeptidase MepM/ murein hydrolase activator NlpD